jgi:hypothetical protein
MQMMYSMHAVHIVTSSLTRVGLQRDNAVGTLNYMCEYLRSEPVLPILNYNIRRRAPEAVAQQTNGGLKLGRPSDVWSLGCIL